MAELGYIVGNVSGQYKPDNPIDKFETSKILAMAAGYKYTDATPNQLSEYDAIYEKYSGLLANYKNTFSKWNPNTDKEVAYLLDKQIYIETDLSQFVIKNDGKENLRALSRQEVAVFLTKLMGKKNAAETFSYTDTFADDSKISVANKPYVYSLRRLGVISGEGNNFNPNGAVTRAAMAIMLDKTLNIMQSDASLPSGDQGSFASPSTAVIEAISGTVEKVHTSLNAVQVKYDTGEIKIHKLEPSASVYIDGSIRTIYELEDDMPVIAIIRDNAIVDIKAQSVKQAPTVTNNNQSNNSSQSNDDEDEEEEKEEKESRDEKDVDIEYRTLQGTITNVRSSLADTQSVTIEVKIINPNGGVITEREDFTVDDDCRIVRGDNDVDFKDIVKNDIVKAKVYNGKAYVLELEEKSRRMNVTVTDKRIDSILGTQFFIVEDSSGKEHQLVVNANTQLTRKGMGNVHYDDIRIGDSLDLIAEYATIVEAYAYGESGYVEGIVTQINSSRDGAYISLLDDNNITTRYYVVQGAFDVYTLRVNSRVRLRLDSKEIEGISVLQKASADYFTGYIDSISARYINLSPLNASVEAGTRVYYNVDTLVTDSTTGMPVSMNNLYAGMKVYVVYTNSRDNVARSITILAK
jgi:hypothetical protein